MYSTFRSFACPCVYLDVIDYINFASEIYGENPKSYRFNLSLRFVSGGTEVQDAGRFYI